MKTTFLRRVFLFLFICCLGLLAQGQSLSKPPDTPEHPVTDEYVFTSTPGVKVTDDYRWLENWDDPAVKQWSTAQNAHTREYLDRLPARAAIKDRLKQLSAATSASYYNLQSRAGMLFVMRYQPPQQKPTLVVMRSADDPASAKIIFDPNVASGKGSEDASAHVIEVATGKELSDIVPRVNFAYGPWLNVTTVISDSVFRLPDKRTTGGLD